MNTSENHLILQRIDEVVQWMVAFEFPIDIESLQSMNEGRIIPNTFAARLKQSCPLINLNWIINGTGDMLLSDEEVQP